MLKLSDFKTASDREYSWLRHQIDGYPLNTPYLLDVCLPQICNPRETVIGFYRTDSQYVIFFEQPVQYSGRNAALKELSRNNSHVVENWPEMVRFCRSFPGGSISPPPAPAAAAGPSSGGETVPGESEITDFSAIEIHSKVSPAPLTFAFIRKELRKSVIGQDFAVDVVSYQLSSHLGKPNPKRPLSLLFHGAPATGKSEMAKAVGALLSHDGSPRYSVVWVDLNTYTEPHTVHNLTGAPASYVGHDETPVFYSVVENPYTVYIWDEVEKSHPAVLRLFMGIMDEGRCASNKELPDHTREYDFRHSIHLFTTNSPIGELGSRRKNPIGFVSSPDIRNISYEGHAVNVEYRPADTEGHPGAALVQRIYEQNEKARKALVRTGVLPEIATRFSGFAEFHPLSESARIRIIAKTILNTGFEYGIRLRYIAPGIIQEMAGAAGRDGFSVRSYRAIAEGYLSDTFAASRGVSGADSGGFRLEGTLAAPQLNPA